MRRIIKGSEPTVLKSFKINNPGADFNTLSKRRNAAIKREVKKSLIIEQLSYCCYCEDIIDVNRPSGSGVPVVSSHIEHFKPKSIYPNLSLDYNNLFASCQSNSTCGHKKGDQQINVNLLSGAGLNFSYEFSGEIIGLNSDASDAINKLNLNNDLLVRQRKKGIDDTWRYMFVMARKGKSPRPYLEFLKNSCLSSHGSFVRIPYPIFVYLAVRQEMQRRIKTSFTSTAL